MQCPYCGADGSNVINTGHASGGVIRRRRVCKSCKARFNTFERVTMTTPLLIKHDGDREAFNREKLTHAIHLACAKRPVSASAINRLADDIEHALQQMGCEEVPSRMVGDMVVRGLRDLDRIACIRYALIYFQLNNLDNVLGEIDTLITAVEH